MTGPPPSDPAEPVEPAEPTESSPPAPADPGAAAEPAGPSPPAVQSTRRLIGASFDLLGRSSAEMRRASFYIGVIVLGTVGPFALASLALERVSLRWTQAQYEELFATAPGALFVALGVLASAGLVVAAVESRTMATAILGGVYADRPIGVRRALARSRMAFWRAIVASIIVSIPVSIASNAVNSVLERLVDASTELSLVASVLVAALVGAPLAYLLTGIVLGDVEPFEALRRSFRVFGARRLAAAVVAVFESLAILLVFLGVGAGLDVALRVFDALGLGIDSGPAGLALIALGIVVGVFALGTLIYTALAISLAPQVVMFVGLTRATLGLDHVRPGGDRDPAIDRPGRPRFRWLTIPMRIGIALGILGIVVFVAVLAT